VQFMITEEMLLYVVGRYSNHQHVRSAISFVMNATTRSQIVQLT
jgi:hypothetical protein